MLFFIVLISAFFALLPRVKKGISAGAPSSQAAAEQIERVRDEVSALGEIQTPKEPEKPQDRPPAEPPSALQNIQKPAEAPAIANNPAETKAPVETRTPAEAGVPAESMNESPTAYQAPAPQAPVLQPAAPQAPPVSAPGQRPAETRDRTIYFMRESSGGTLQLANVTRKIEASNTPLADALAALLAGPSGEERSRGLVSFIPPGSQIISAQVSNNTVILNFNEEFRYNTLGREGGEAQIRQIVWTATEFPNISNVQIMIEGSIVDFLMEGVRVRNPIGR